MLMLCFGMSPPAGLNEIKDARYEARELLRGKPGHRHLAAEPGLLPLGKAARRSHRLVDRRFEGQPPAQVRDELAVTDGLERGERGIEPLGEPSSDLLHPPLLDHPGYAT